MTLLFTCYTKPTEKDGDDINVFYENCVNDNDKEI